MENVPPVPGPAMKDPRGRDPWIRRIGPAADAGSTLSGSVIGCLLIGYALGEYFDVNPASTVIGLFVGIVVGLWNLAKIMWLNK